MIISNRKVPKVFQNYIDCNYFKVNRKNNLSKNSVNNINLEEIAS